MKLFENKNTDKDRWTDRAATGIAMQLLRWQAKWTKKANVFFLSKSRKVLKRYLVFFCLVGGCFSGIVLFNALLGDEIKRTLFEIGQTSVPGHIIREAEQLNGDVTLDGELLHEILAFQTYLDSVKQNAPRSYDSLIKLRPGLLDSLQMLQEICLPTKNKLYEP